MDDLRGAFIAGAPVEQRRAVSRTFDRWLPASVVTKTSGRRTPNWLKNWGCRQNKTLKAIKIFSRLCESRKVFLAADDTNQIGIADFNCRLKQLETSMVSADLRSNNAIDYQLGNRQSGNRQWRVLRPTSIQVERELEVVQLMDNQFRLPILGWRFGLNAIIDLIPEFGDIARRSLRFTFWFRRCVPCAEITLLRMGLNIAIYFIGGLVPLAGDVFAIWWKPEYPKPEPAAASRNGFR